MPKRSRRSWTAAPIVTSRGDAARCELPDANRLTADRKVSVTTYPGVATLRILNGGSDRVKVVDTVGERLSV